MVVAMVSPGDFFLRYKTLGALETQTAVHHTQQPASTTQFGSRKSTKSRRRQPGSKGRRNLDGLESKNHILMETTTKKKVSIPFPISFIFLFLSFLDCTDSPCSQAHKKSHVRATAADKPARRPNPGGPEELDDKKKKRRTAQRRETGTPQTRPKNLGGVGQGVGLGLLRVSGHTPVAHSTDPNRRPARPASRLK